MNHKCIDTNKHNITYLKFQTCLRYFCDGAEFSQSRTKSFKSNESFLISSFYPYSLCMHKMKVKIVYHSELYMVK